MAEPLEIAVGSVDITPQHALPLAGFEERTEPFEALADPLEINAILLRQGLTSSLILSVDALYVGDRIEAAVRRRLERAGLGDCVIVAAASHTHFAPNLDAGKPQLGDRDERFCEEVEEKAAGLVDRLVGMPGVRARVRYAVGQADHSINRRRRGWQLSGGRPHRLVQMRANPDGPNDQSVHLLRFDDEAGTPQALLWNYACHPVAFPRLLDVTAEFPGVVRMNLRGEFGADVPVLFLQGFSGDLRPPAIIRPGRNPSRWLADVFQGPAIGRFSEAAFRQWSESLARLVLDLASSGDLDELAPALHHQTRSLSLSTMIDGDTGQQELNMTQLELSDDLQLFAVTAEVVVEYTDHLRNLFPGVRTIPVGCAGSAYGYLPTKRMVEEGGYEARDFFESFSLSGHFEPAVENHALGLMRTLVR